jgi:hypothetical protein
LTGALLLASGAATVAAEAPDQGPPSAPAILWRVPHRSAAWQGFARSAGVQGWYPLDSFEDADWPDPDLWTLPNRVPPTWWPSSCQAKTGRKALWSFGGPTSRGELPCASAAPPNTAATLYMNLDLRSAATVSRLDLFFELWLGFAPGDDSGVFLHLITQDNGNIRRVPIFGGTNTNRLWAYPARQLDLTRVSDISDPAQVFDLRGGRWTMEWTALARAGAPAGGGAFVDDVSLVWEPDPAFPTPTTRPTGTATPTATPSPTASSTATATPAPPSYPAYLPLVAQQAILVAPTPTPTATSTPEDEWTPTPATPAAPDVSPTPTDLPTPGPSR